MLDRYAEAFSRYLRSGQVGELARFCAPDAEVARLAVYRNGFFKACGEALRSNYPAVERAVGEAFFSTLARGYVERFPPRLGTLVAYGGEFPRFVGDALEVHRLPYLASIASLDRAWLEVYFAAEAQPLEAGALAGLSEAAVLELRCRLMPDARLLVLDFAALDAWAALRRGELRGATEIRRASQPVSIWRRDGEVCYRGLGVPEHAFLARVAHGATCAEAAEAALALDPTFEVGDTFAALLENRLLTAGPGRSAT